MAKLVLLLGMLISLSSFAISGRLLGSVIASDNFPAFAPDFYVVQDYDSATDRYPAVRLVSWEGKDIAKINLCKNPQKLCPEALSFWVNQSNMVSIRYDIGYQAELPNGASQWVDQVFEDFYQFENGKMKKLGGFSYDSYNYSVQTHRPAKGQKIVATCLAEQVSTSPTPFKTCNHDGFHILDFAKGSEDFIASDVSLYDEPEYLDDSRMIYVDKTFWIYDFASQTKTDTSVVMESEFLKIASYQNQEYAFFAGYNGELQIWNLAKNKMQKSYQFDDSIEQIFIPPNSNLMILFEDNKRFIGVVDLRTWEVVTGFENLQEELKEGYGWTSLIDFPPGSEIEITRRRPNQKMETCLYQVDLITSAAYQTCTPSLDVIPNVYYSGSEFSVNAKGLIKEVQLTSNSEELLYDSATAQPLIPREGYMELLRLPAFPENSVIQSTTPQADGTELLEFWIIE